MFLIVGLGNPGEAYERTRHNVGFMLVDRLSGAHNIDFSVGSATAVAGRGVIKGVPVALVKPQTFMNLSGQAVGEYVSRLGVGPERVLVAYDDVDLPLGRIRVRRGGGSGGHRGMESVAVHLGSTDFPRIRLGIGRPEAGEVSEYVLSPFDLENTGILDEMLARGVEAVEAILIKGVEFAMNRFNASD